MSQINSRLGIHDGMSGPLKNMCKTMGIVISTMRSMADASGQSVNVASLDAANDLLAKMNAEFNAIEENYKAINTQQRQYNTSLSAGASNAGNLMRNIMGAVGTYVGLKEIVGLSDSLASGSQRLSLIVDDNNTVESLDQKIYDFAQRARASYTDTMNIVAKLGLTAKKAFDSNDEIIYFSELMAKNFTIGSASATEKASAMYQLTQAMSSGRLQGDEYRSIIENAPLLAQSIEDYMINVQGATGSMKEWASEGLLTSDVIKNAMFSSAEEIETRFEDMPMTWGQIGTMSVNKIVQIGQPLLRLISSIAQNWSVLEPIVVGVAVAIGGLAAVTAVYNLHQKIANGLALISAARNAIKSGASLAEAASTTTATGAQIGFNAALLACPLTWILLIIIAVIAVIYAVVAAINKAKGTTVSATGVIFGAISALAAYIWNGMLALLEFVLGIINYLVNPFINFANFIANVFENPISSVIYLFQSMADNVLGILQKIASGMDFVFGTNMADTVQGWRDGLKSKADELVAKYAPNENYQAVMNNLDLSVEALGLSRISYSDAYNAGYGAGQSLDNKIGGLVGSLSYDIKDIADLTSDINDTLSRSEEELEYLRDIAERETINRFTTAEIKVDFSGMTNRIEGEADINGFIEALTEDFSEALATAAEGVR